MVQTPAFFIPDRDIGGIGERSHRVDQRFDACKIVVLHGLNQFRHRRDLHRLNQCALADLIVQSIFGDVREVPRHCQHHYRGSK